MAIIIFFVLGAIIGSFLNVVILRLRSGESFLAGRSKCPHCRHALSPADLAPILSFVFLRGRCRHCRERISWQYPLVEFASAAVFAAVFAFGGSWLMILRNLIAASALIVIFVYDLKWREIPDQVSLPALIAVLALNFLLNPLSLSYLIAAFIGAAFFAAQYYLSDGKWVGGGDVRLGALLGAILGWPALIVGLLIAYVCGACVGIYLLIKSEATGKTELPFGVFLAPAAIIALFWGQYMIDWYIGML